MTWWVVAYCLAGARYSLAVPDVICEAREARGEPVPDHVPTWLCVVAGLLWLPLTVLEFAARVW